MGLFILVRIPFDGWVQNTTLIINNLCYTVVLVLFLVIEKNKSLGPKERHYKLGTPCVVFIIIIVMINLAVAVFTIVALIVEAWKKAKVAKCNKVWQVALKLKRGALES